MQTETRLLIADDWEDYALLDSGHLQKLERFGSQTVIRPSTGLLGARPSGAELESRCALCHARHRTKTV